MKIVLLGPPGAGKGTLASCLKEKIDLLHISTGDILREEMKQHTPLGEEAKKYVENGDLVPDDLVIRLIEKKISSEDSLKGFMFDGFPRTVAQAEGLDALLSKIGHPLDYAVYMDADLDVITKRLTGRRVCRNCGAVYHVVNRPPKVEGVCDACNGNDLYQRADDNEETIHNRMEVYLKNTLPIVEYYEKKDILLKVDGTKQAEDLTAELLNAFEKNAKHN